MSMSSHSILCTRTVWIVIANISNVLNLALLPIQGWLSIDTILKNALVDKKRYKCHTTPLLFEMALLS
jgi:hypothetical protein